MDESILKTEEWALQEEYKMEDRRKQEFEIW
jgi:hypothetical protein